MPFVYKLTNRINGKIYVGATKRLPINRFKEHCRDAARFPSRALYADINKYGKDKFELEILEECEETELDFKESFWINELHTFENGYNSTYGGSGKPFVDVAMIIDLWNDGNNVKEIARLTSHDAITITKALEMCGISSCIRKGRGKLAICKGVAQLDIKNQQILHVYPSIKEAYEQLGKQPSGHIASVCEGKRTTAYGYGWKYL